MTGPDPTPRRSSIDRLFSDWEGDRPGGAVAVTVAGEVAHRAAYGTADLVTRAPFRTDHRFPVASLTKHMTTLCILLLQGEGRLDLEDQVNEIIPGLLSVDAPISIRHLCANTSGLRDYITLATFAGQRLITGLRAAMIEKLIRGQTSLNFSPGSEYSYSNSNFVVLGWILERLTGWPLETVFSRLLFEPLGMASTSLIRRSTDTPPNAVKGYSGVAAGFLPWSWDTDLAGEGGVWSSLDDLVKWEQNFARPRVGSQSILRRLGELQLLNDGRSSNYALGLRRGETLGCKWEGHSGGWEGYRSFRLRLVETGVGIVVFANHTADIESAAMEVAHCCLSWAEPARLRPLVGRYRSDELDTTLTLEENEGQLLLSIRSSIARQEPMPLTRTGPHTFAPSRAARARWNVEFDTSLSFDPTEEAAVQGLRISSEPARNVEFRRV
jgi:CubicO group peptidase (beta-lactamase class C family)